ncbi:UNVERIFIED_CONTAM: hypothetical protein Scaly_1002500 [Sesamum calycinum]|uniref:CCHC-type domain-containing protein n=1 Tax=Sesamum calycinum TaxID=2727403 RepID=A0AAW2QZJ0_9LAMI
MAEPISVAIPIAPKVDLTGLPDKFSGQFFKRWQQRMKIWLTMKGLLTVIQVTRPEPTDTDPKTVEIAQWTERDQIGRGAILSALSNTLFDSIVPTPILPNLYGMSWTENIILKSKGSKSILFLSSCGIIWLRIGRLSLDDLMIAISIEEEHRNQTHKMPVEHQPRANLIVEKQRVNKINSNLKAINKGKTTKNKKPKANKPCWNCGQVGHWAKLCPNKKAKTGQAVVNMVVGDASTSGATEGPSLERQVPLKHNTSTPFELWKDRKPSLKYFRVWGCLAKVLVPEHKRKKLGPKTVDAVFLGYVETSYALRFLIIKSEIPSIEVNTIVEFRDPVFLEDVFPMKIGIPSSVSLDDSLASTSIPEHVEKMTNVGVNPNSNSLTHEELDIPRRSKRARVVKDFGSDFVTYNIEDDPVTFKDTMASSEAK